MLSRLTLSQKVLFFLAVLLAFQLIFISALAYLQFTTEEQTRKANHARQLSAVVRELSNEIFDIMTSCKGTEALKEGPDGDIVVRTMTECGGTFAKMKKLTQDSEKERALVLHAERNLTEAARVFAQLKDDYKHTGDAGELGRLMLWKKMRQLSTRDMFMVLKDLDSDQGTIVEEDPPRQADFRSQLRTLLFASLAVTVFSILSLARYLITNITSRLGVMSDNAYRLACDLPLNSPLPGKDEIAVLDRTFHDMARLLQEAHEKETAIVENAQDVICSLDDEGRFTSVNKAVETLIGLKPADLAGRQAVELILDEDVSTALQFFDQAQKGKKSGTLEVRMRRNNGAVLDTLWSTQWSDKDNSLFCVIHDITLRKQAERLKEEVVAMVNHDLRTPLTTVQVSLQLLKESERGHLTPKGEALLESMSTSCVQLLHLTQDLLDLDRLDSGHLEMDIENCNIGLVAMHSIELTHGLAHKQKIKISTEIQDLFVKGDTQRLEQIITNILTNAMKYSPAGSRVHLAVKKDPELSVAIVSVRDEGPGIPPAMQSQVFDRYQRIKENPSATNDGGGLGLAICKALVQQHGGKIWVESKVGQGSTFIFTVPLAAGS